MNFNDAFTNSTIAWIICLCSWDMFMWLRSFGSYSTNVWLEDMPHSQVPQYTVYVYYNIVMCLYICSKWFGGEMYQHAYGTSATFWTVWLEYLISNFHSILSEKCFLFRAQLNHSILFLAVWTIFFFKFQSKSPGDVQWKPIIETIWFQSTSKFTRTHAYRHDVRTTKEQR